MFGKQASLSTHELGPLVFSSASRLSLASIILKQCETAHSGFCIGYVNPHVCNMAETEPVVHSFINQCDLVCIDGLGTALALRGNRHSACREPVHRVVALNLFDELLKQTSQRQTAVLIGVETEEVRMCAANINAHHRRFKIIDTLDGFCAPVEYQEFLTRHSNVQWVLIGAGSPKSEAIALQARLYCPVAIVFHMGAGTIKVYAGIKRRAPTWVSRYGLEWAHRMIFESHTRERYTKGGWQFLKSQFRHRHGSKSKRSSQ